MTNRLKQQENNLIFDDNLKYSIDREPLVSIITVVLNSEKYIDKTINSVLNQTYKNCEYIIIDGGSTDRTIEIIKKYEDKIDYSISEIDSGIYDAMNKGICLAHGHIIGILNSGDFYANDTVEKVINTYNLNKRQNDFGLVVIGAMYRFSENEEVRFKQNSNKFDSCGPIVINHPATFVTCSVYNNIGSFNLKYRISADYDFILRAYHDEKIHFIFIDDALTNMLMGGFSEKFSTIFTRLKERFHIRGKYINVSENINNSCYWLLRKFIYHLLSSIIGYQIFIIKILFTCQINKLRKKYFFYKIRNNEK